MDSRLDIPGCVALLLMMVCLACGAEDLPARQVRLQLSCTKADHVLGEPIWATLSVSNETDSVVEFTIGNSSEDSFTFAISNAMKGSFEMLCPYFSFGGLTQRQVLRPGQVFSREILLTEYIWFKRPGRYNVQCDIKFPILTGGHAIRASENPATEIVIGSNENRLAEILRKISESAKNPNPQVRTRAVRSLASVRSPLTLEFLGQALEDNDEAVVETALRGISRIGGTEAIRLLSQYASKHEGTELGKFAARLMDRRHR